MTPFPMALPYPPMEAKRDGRLPSGDGWQFEPKWDGFRCLVFRSDDGIIMQSKSGQPLSRYFPELLAAFQQLPAPFILDGEIVIARENRLSFDDLLQRIHPAASRIARLARETPATYLAFDLLYEPGRGGRLLADRALRDRRARLEGFFEAVPRNLPVFLTPATTDRRVALQWFAKLGSLGFDGVMAKKLDEPYHPGDREAMIKVKHLKTADCVVGGFRYGEGKRAREIGSLLLGLYDEDGLLHHVGHTSSFSADERRGLKTTLEGLRGGGGFTGRAPGGPSRWSTKRSGEWEPVDPQLVCEVQYDYFSQGRFRHGSKFLRWRPDKSTTACTFEQVEHKSTGRPLFLRDVQRSAFSAGR